MSGVWIIIPVKGTGEAKGRLAGVLSPAQRLGLAGAMLAHVLDAVQAARGIAKVVLVAPAGADLPDGCARIDDPGLGLNAALTRGLAQAALGRAERAVIIAGDLPCLRPDQVEALARVPAHAIAIAPDRHGAGTNALSLPLPAAGAFAFAYGEGSLAAHYRECARLGLEPRIIDAAGLARDVDTPDDLPDARGLWE